MFGIFGQKFTKPTLICCAIWGLAYIAELKLLLVIEFMKNDDIVDDAVGVEATGRLLFGENVPANGFVIWADTGSAQPSKSAAPNTKIRMRTIDLPRFENGDTIPHKEAGR